MHLIGGGGYWLDKNTPMMIGTNALKDIIKCVQEQDGTHYVKYDWVEKKFSPYNGEWD